MGKKVNCCLCGLSISDETLGKQLEGDTCMCTSCNTTYKNAAHMICKKCGKYITVMEPGVIKENGFEIKPCMIIHVDTCIECTPDAKESKILEIVEWKKRRKK